MSCSLFESAEGDEMARVLGLLSEDEGEELEEGEDGEDGEDGGDEEETREERLARMQQATTVQWHQLQTLKDLLSEGFITEEEYEHRKEQIIEDLTGTVTVERDQVLSADGSELGVERDKPGHARSRSMQQRSRERSSRSGSKGSGRSRRRDGSKSSSSSSSSSSLRRKGSRKRMEAQLPHRPPPDWSKIKAERAIKHEFDPITRKWSKKRLMVKLDDKPFALGSLRAAFHMLVLDDEEEEDIRLYDSCAGFPSLEESIRAMEAMDDVDMDSLRGEQFINDEAVGEAPAPPPKKKKAGAGQGGGGWDRSDGEEADRGAPGQEKNLGDSSSLLHPSSAQELRRSRESNGAKSPRSKDTSSGDGDGSNNTTAAGSQSVGSSGRRRIRDQTAPASLVQTHSAPRMNVLMSPGAIQPGHYVAKMSRKQGEGRESYFHDVEIQMYAKEWADKFNLYNPPKKVTFIKAWVLELYDRSHRPICGVERYISGSYRKHNNNYGFVNEDERNTPQAFSHFTYHISDGTMLMCDIQGVGDCYTDPQIHTASRRPFGKGDLGKVGFERFLSTHRCNAICRFLMLPSINAKIDDQGTVPSSTYYRKSSMMDDPRLHANSSMPLLSTGPQGPMEDSCCCTIS
eukprot:TRINITY_DN2183_c0_g1_i1.p1 TRINITY_DN2183_c0_g1~~TRINITY_DN2183_c0_g1_i1.p1  ORF type:complete len:628 (-),score=126.14 TRINITY_DN2183_c0_g1_i1:97-1980(-)